MRVKTPDYKLAKEEFDRKPSKKEIVQFLGQRWLEQEARFMPVILTWCETADACDRYAKDEKG